VKSWRSAAALVRAHPEAPSHLLEIASAPVAILKDLARRLTPGS